MTLLYVKLILSANRMDSNSEATILTVFFFIDNCHRQVQLMSS